MSAQKLGGTCLVAVGYTIITYCLLDGIAAAQTGTPNNKCCNPARVDPASNPGGCFACDDCMQCHNDGRCIGTASTVAVPGGCQARTAKNCSDGIGIRNIKLGEWSCNVLAYPNCSCEWAPIPLIPDQQVQVADCSGDPC